MTWFAIYKLGTGELVSSGSSIADPLPEGLGAKEYSEKPEKVKWNPELLDYEPFTPPPKPVDRIDFLRRFTQQERKAVRNLRNTDDALDDFMYLLEASVRIDPMDADVVAGLNYLEAINCIESGRADEIRGVNNG